MVNADLLYDFRNVRITFMDGREVPNNTVVSMGDFVTTYGEMTHHTAPWVMADTCPSIRLTLPLDGGAKQ